MRSNFRNIRSVYNFSMLLGLTLFCCTCHPLMASQKPDPSHADFPLKSIRAFYPRIESLLLANQKSSDASRTPMAHGDCRWEIDRKLEDFENIIFKDVQKANLLNETVLHEALGIDYHRAYYQALYNKAFATFIQGEFDTAYQLVEGVEQLNPELESHLAADFATLKSYIHTEKGAYDRALELALTLLNRAEAQDDHYATMRASSALSHYYLRKEDYVNSLKYCLRGLDYIIELRQIRNIFPKIDEIARMTAKMGRRDIAVEVYAFYDRMEAISGPTGSYIKSIVLMNRADIYLEEELFGKARAYLEEAIAINAANNYRFRIPRAYMQLAAFHLKQRDTLSAIQSYENSLAAADSIKAYDVIKKTSGILAGLYRSQDKPELANKYLGLFKMINDTFFTEARNNKILAMESQLKIKDAQAEIQALRSRNRMQTSQLNWLLGIALLMLTAGVGASYAYYKIRNKMRRVRNNPPADPHEPSVETARQIEPVKKQEIPKTRAHNSPALDDDVREIILCKLDKLEKEKFFIESSCSLNKLAKMLKTNTKYLSLVINEEKKCHFNAYINELRIQHLLHRLECEPDFRSESLSKIAGAVGYNNLNTLNSAFKKRMGMLPSRYIKFLKNNRLERAVI